MMLLQIIVH